jgi:hypothetical protein
MARPRRPARYRVRVATPDWTAELLIEHGFCTGADPRLVDCIGASAPWIKGHLAYQGWRATMLPAPEQASSGPAQPRETLL